MKIFKRRQRWGWASMPTITMEVSLPTKVYAYTVYYQDSPFVFDWEWKRTTFAKKKVAQKFARKYKNKKHPPYPYIIRTIKPRDFFRKDVEIEVAIDETPRKFIKY